MSKTALKCVGTHRIRSLQIEVDNLLSLLQLPKGGSVVDGQVVTFGHDAIPQDATAAGVHISDDKTIILIINHESFDVVEEGDPIPELRTTYVSEDVT